MLTGNSRFGQLGDMILVSQSMHEIIACKPRTVQPFLVAVLTRHRRRVAKEAVLKVGLTDTELIHSALITK